MERNKGNPKNEEKMFPEYRRNEYGYIPNWFKYNELDNNF